MAAGLLRYLGRASAEVVCKFQGLGPDVEGGGLVQARPAGVLSFHFTALGLRDQREAPAAVSELREGDAGFPREGARHSTAIPSPVPADSAFQSLTFSAKSLIPTVRVGSEGSGALGCA